MVAPLTQTSAHETATTVVKNGSNSSSNSNNRTGSKNSSSSNNNNNTPQPHHVCPGGPTGEGLPPAERDVWQSVVKPPLVVHRHRRLVLEKVHHSTPHQPAEAGQAEDLLKFFWSNKIHSRI